jgi:two-component system nitrogen regulation response regulator GlnG
VRIVAATHRDLRTLIQQGLFREDLYYRLNVVPLRLPPLRERADDIGDLVRHFLRQNARQGLSQKTIAMAAIDALKRHDWPGNVRELENMVRRMTALQPEDQITAEMVEAQLAALRPGPQTEAALGDPASLAEMVEQHLSRYFAGFGRDLPPPGLYDRVLAEIERPLLIAALTATRGNQIKAADLLGLNRNTLRKKVRDLDIQVFRGAIG